MTAREYYLHRLTAPAPRTRLHLIRLHGELALARSCGRTSSARIANCFSITVSCGIVAMIFSLPPQSGSGNFALDGASRKIGAWN
ncbi:MAG: hypothetical protein OEY03_02350 [Rhizobacter sp.]|nr:hypothetical protein [Rhizobacter sp.]